MIICVALGFVLGAPFWAAVGASLMGRLCAQSRPAAQEEQDDWDMSRP